MSQAGVKSLLYFSLIPKSEVYINMITVSLIPGDDVMDLETCDWLFLI